MTRPGATRCTRAASDVRRQREERSKIQVERRRGGEQPKSTKATAPFHEQARDCTPGEFKDERCIDDKCEYRGRRWHRRAHRPAQGKTVVNVAGPARSSRRPGKARWMTREGRALARITRRISGQQGEDYVATFSKTQMARASRKGSRTPRDPTSAVRSMRSLDEAHELASGSAAMSRPSGA